jgi:hypothetical protein
VNVTRNPSRLRRKRDRVGQPARCEGWEGEQRVMQSRSIWRPGQPTYPQALSNAGFRLGPDPRRALWRAATCAAQKGRTHGRTDECCCICEESSHAPPISIARSLSPRRSVLRKGRGAGSLRGCRIAKWSMMKRVSGWRSINAVEDPTCDADRLRRGPLRHDFSIAMPDCAAVSYFSGSQLARQAA